MSKLSQEQEELMTRIHEIANDKDHNLVVYSQDEKAMLRQIIHNLEKKLVQIADMANAACESN